MPTFEVYFNLKKVYISSMKQVIILMLASILYSSCCKKETPWVNPHFSEEVIIYTAEIPVTNAKDANGYRVLVLVKNLEYVDENFYSNYLIGSYNKDSSMYYVTSSVKTSNNTLGVFINIRDDQAEKEYYNMFYDKNDFKDTLKLHL